MSEKVECKGNKQEPVDYKRLHWEKYLDLLDNLEMNNDNKTDKLGLEKDEKENEYLFFFQHPNLKYYVYNIFDEKDEHGNVLTYEINFFGDIVVRDFSYYSDMIMTMQLANADEVLKNIQDAYLGRMIETNCEYNSKAIFMRFWLPRVKQQMETIMENNPNSIEIDNYVDLYDEIKMIEEDLKNDFPKFNRRHQLSKTHFKADDLLSFLRKDRSFGQYCKEKQKFTLNYSLKEISYIVGRFFYDLNTDEEEEEKVNQKIFCERFSTFFLRANNKEIKTDSLYKQSSTFQRKIVNNLGNIHIESSERYTFFKSEYDLDIKNNIRNPDDPIIHKFIKTFYKFIKHELPDNGHRTI
jgi:hypothetical protein